MSTPARQKYQGIPRSVWALGMVSLFMDTSSELVHSLLPLFMVTALGASMTAVGLVEGIAEATAQITKIFSGALSDYLGKRKLLALIGYGMGACSKPFFPLAHSLYAVIAARLADRIGKGIRGAPRDALVSDITPPEVRGAAYGLRQSLDNIGAVIGPLLAMLFMLLLAGDIRSVLWIAVIPAFISVVVLVLGVKEPDRDMMERQRTPFRFRDIGRVGKAYWYTVAIASIMTLARFSEAFLVLAAQHLGVALALVPLVIVMMNIVYAASSYPVGRLSDRMDRYALLAIGIALLVMADIVLGTAGNVWMLGIGVALWGLHMGFTQGLLAAIVSDTVPAHLRGTAFGVFNFACGIALLAASVIAGLLWDIYGPQATFFTGAIFAVAALAGLLAIRRNG